jgi:endo-1,4-beta-D-glucanase Y
MANATLPRPAAAPYSRPAPSPAQRARAWLNGLGLELPLVLLLGAVALIAHAINMFQYPALDRFDDEGIYIAQAWAVLRQFRLSPYTYWYDHAPVGWMVIAAWMGLTGGPLTFGSAIDSGRILVLLLHVLSVPLLYRVARKLGIGIPAAALTTLLFSISPLSIFYGRLALLDPIMLFFILLSLDLLLNGWGQLSRVTLSGACFGLALLSKETAVFLLPAMLFIAVQQRWRHQGRFALIGWLFPMLIVTSWYPLYAALKGELLPAGQAFNFVIFSVQTGDSVSLTDAVRWQMTRTGDNQFWRLVREEWLARDALLFGGGALAIGVNLLRGLFNRRAMAAGLLGLLPLVYLGRGGIVFDFYILFAIPFLCLNLGMLVQPVLARLPARVSASLALVLAGGVAGGYWQAGLPQPFYMERPGVAVRDAIGWIKANVPPESRIVARDGYWTDLREPGLGGPAFPHIHSHWKVASDPAIRDGVFHGNWRRVDYVIISGDLARVFQETGNTVAAEALGNAHLVRRWETDGHAVELWKTDQPGATERALLAEADAAIARRFGREGAFADADGSVTSEAQAYAMLRAVWSNDRAAFDRAWGWTQAHLLNPKGLPSWLWRDGRVIDAHSATDADTDMALALLLAGQRWGDAGLRAAGTRMVEAIWQHEVVVVNGSPYLVAGDWIGGAPVIALNPSYFAPYAYRIFQQVDPQHDWMAVVESSYRVLFEASALPLGGDRSAGLPPDWVGLERASGRLVPLTLPEGRDTTRYSYDAARTYWRVALDGRWSGDGRADAYLRNAGFLTDEVRRKGFVSATYSHAGIILEEGPSVVGTAGALGVVAVVEPALAHGLVATQLIGGNNRDEAGVYWGSPGDLYAQEWAWFALALYADALPDLWTQPMR